MPLWAFYSNKASAAYFCHRWTYPSGAGGFGGLGGSFGFGGLVLDGRILGALGFGSDTAFRFQGMAFLRV